VPLTVCEHRICSIYSHFQTFVFRKGAHGLWNHAAVQTLRLKTTQQNTTQHSTAQHNTAQHNTAQHNTAQYNTTQHNTAQHSTTQHNTAQHTPTQIWWYYSLSFLRKLKLKWWICGPRYVCIKKLILVGEFYDLTYPQRIIKAQVSGLTELTMILFLSLGNSRNHHSFTEVWPMPLDHECFTGPVLRT